MTPLQRIRSLLEAYYSGEASPQQVCQLAKLLQTAPDLPTEFATDRELLRLLGACNPAPLPSPAGLDEIMETTINRCATQSHRRTHRIMRRLIAVSASAAAALIVGLLLFTPRSDGDSADAEIYAATDFQDSVPPQLHSTIPDNKQTAPVSNAAVSKPLEASTGFVTEKRQTRRRMIAADAPVEQAAAPNLRIVTDPAEAADYADMAFRLLAENFRESAAVQLETSATINDIKSEIKNALIDLQR